MPSMFRELSFAARSLRKAPAFVATSVLTLAVGVGATTALFSVVYGILLRPLPYPDPATLVRFTAERTIGSKVYGANFSALEFPEWARRNHAFAEVAAFAGSGFGLLDERGTTNVLGTYVSPEFFHLVGRPMLAGRAIGASDAHAPVMVISRRFATERFGSDADVVGRALVLDGRPYTIVGIADDEFRIPSDQYDVWVPLGYGQDIGVPYLVSPGGGGVTLIGRLRSGVTLQQARDDLRLVTPEVAAVYPRIAKDRRVSVERLSDWLTDAVRPTLLIFAAAVALVLVLTTANLVNLQLAREMARRRETAIHLALGASRGQLATRALAEATLLVGAGSVVALGVAWAGVNVLLWMKPADVPRLEAIRVDVPVLLFTLGVAALVTLTVGLVSVARAATGDPAALLQRAAGTHTAGVSARRFRSFLVAVSLPPR
jgi:putative ABC transport system permease protein